MTWKSWCLTAVLSAGLIGSVVRAEDAPKASPATRPTTKPTSRPTSRPKLPTKPRTPADAVGEVDRNPKRHEAFMKEIKDGGPFGLVFIGDSITDFWPARSKDTWAKFDEYKPLDLGISGECTEDVLFRLNHGELDGLAPKAVVIMIGTNNIGHYADEKPEWTAAGVEKIVKTVRDKTPDAKILLLGVFPRGNLADSPIRRKVTALNERIAKLDDGSHVKYLDIGKAFLDEKGDIPKDVMGDSLHPTDKGYHLWFDAMWPTLSEMVK